MKRFKVISVEHEPWGSDYVGKTFTGPVAVKLGWRDLNGGLKLIFDLELGGRISDDDGWVWERVA